MFKRQISLYFGSITVWRSLQAIGIWLASLWTKASDRRNRLHKKIQNIYFPATEGVFSFGSGRSALTACLKAAGIGPGDEVLLSAYTCLAVPTAIIAAGAKPIYADINEKTLNVEWITTSGLLTSTVRAIVVQHTLGKPAEIKTLLNEAKKRGILVIEDCALAIGTRINTQYVGTFADAAIFSMELSKTISSGWGGILLVNNTELAKDVKKLYSGLSEPSWWHSSRDLWQTVISSCCYQAFVPDLIRRYVIAAGFKSHFFRPSTPTLEFDGIVDSHFLLKMAGSQAALALLQWKNFFKIISACERNASQLREVLLSFDIRIPGYPNDNEVSVTPRVSILVNNRELITRYFAERGVELGQWFDGPLSPIPNSSLFNYQPGSFPVAERIANQVINFPCHSRLTKRDLNHITSVLEQFIKEFPDCVVRGKLSEVDSNDKNWNLNLCAEL